MVPGLDDASDAKAFIKLAKQYWGYHHKQAHSGRLWERYGYERVIRDDSELAFTIGYIVANPVRAGLVVDPAAYPHLGSDCYTIAEMMEICEYSKRWVGGP